MKLSENALLSTLQKFEVFSPQTNGTLQNITTKDLATPEIVQSPVQAPFFGQIKFERFVEQRLLSSDREEEERFVERRLLSPDREEEERWREEGAKQNFRVLFEEIIRLHLPTFIPVIN